MLTINNPTKEEVKTIDELYDDDGVIDLIGQHEEGEQEGTLHIQLLINWKNPRSFNGVKKLFPRAHIEPAKHLVKAAKYCSKEETRVEGLEMWEKIGSKSLLREWNKEQEQVKVVKRPITKGSRDPLEGKEPKWWQKEIMDLYGTEPDERKIYWYWSHGGGVGKSNMVTHLHYNYDDVIVITGSTRDAKYVLRTWCEEREWEKDPRMIVYDIARCQDSEKISYQAIEDMKNEVKVSTKYESGTYQTAIPHVVVFANTWPDESKMSKDRWVIKNIDDAGDIPEGYESDSEIPMEW